MVLDLHRKNVFPAGDDHVLFAVHQPDEALLVPAGHVAGQQPAVHHRLGAGLGIFVVFLHHPRPPNVKLPGLPVRRRPPVAVDDPAFPVETRQADGPHFVAIFQPQMDAARPGGLGEAVIGVVFVVRKNLGPFPHQAGRNGLSADVHQPPLVQLEFRKVDLPRFHRQQDVVGPGHQQPDHRGALLGDRLQNPTGLGSFQNHRFSADDEIAEPVHFRAGVVERRNAKKIVFVGLVVVAVFHVAGEFQVSVGEMHRLGPAGGAGGEIERGAVVRPQRNPGGFIFRVRQNGGVGLREIGTLLFRPHVNIGRDGGVQLGLDLPNSFHELRTENEPFRAGNPGAAGDGRPQKAEVQRRGPGPGAKNAEVDGQPFQTVGHELDHFFARPDPPVQQGVGQGAGFPVEIGPGDGPPEISLGLAFHQGHFVAVLPGVARKDFRDDHASAFRASARRREKTKFFPDSSEKRLRPGKAYRDWERGCSRTFRNVNDFPEKDIFPENDLPAKNTGNTVWSIPDL